MRDLAKTDFQNYLFTTPYPHIVVDDFLPTEDYSPLMNELVLFEKQFRRTNRDPSLFCGRNFTFLEKKSPTNFPAIREVSRYFKGKEFSSSVIETFLPYMNGRLDLASEEARGFADKEEFRSSFFRVFDPDPFVKIRKAHSDNNKSIFAFLYYARLPNDYSSGGDLQIFSMVDRFKNFSFSMEHGLYFPEKSIRLTKTVEYKPNRLVIFINGFDYLTRYT